MITKIKMAVLLGACAFTVNQASANLIVNGSFEDPNLNGNWGLFTSIPGWTVPTGSPKIEIGAGGIYGVTGYAGKQVMELDSTANVTVDQIVGSVGSYTLSFLYAQRSGVSTTSGSFDVYWNGALLQSLSPSSTAMSLFSTTVSGQSVNKLEFKGTGTSDSYGALVDDVRLEVAPVPEPTTVLAGVLLLLPFGLSTLRSFRKS